MTFVSFAQNYEDVRLWRALGHIERGCYLDIGAQDPVMDSVSKAFYDQGWRGAHVEATPVYAAALRDHRPDEAVFEVAIGDLPGPMTFYEFPDTGMSTGIAEIARAHSEKGFAVRLREVPVVPLSQVLADFGAETIHWMKIDVEGMERDVLSSWGSSPVKPWVLVVESVHPASRQPSEQAWYDLVLARGYEEVAFDGLSRYFVAEEHRNLAAALAAPPHIFDDFRVTRFHFSAQLVAAEDNAAIQSMETATARLEAELSAEQERGHALQGTIAALTDERETMLAAHAAALTDERETMLAAHAAALTDERETMLAAHSAALHERETKLTAQGEAIRAELDLNLAHAVGELRQSEAAAAALRAEIDQWRDHAREAEGRLADMVARHEQANARTSALRSTLLSDFAEVTRSRDELQSALDEVRRQQESPGDATLRALEARVMTLEENNRAAARDAEIGPSAELTSEPEAVGAAVQSSESPDSLASVEHNLSSLVGEFCPMTLNDLLEFHDGEFIRRAYKVLLKRDADPAGFVHYTRQLRRGRSRVRLLADIARSAEARAVDANVPGLRSALRRQHVRDLLLLQPLRSRLFGEEPEGSVIVRLRAIENRLATLGAGPVGAPPQAVAPDAPVTPPVAAPDPVAQVVVQMPVEAAPDLSVVTMDADRMIAAKQWPAVIEGLFDRQWPKHWERSKSVRIDSRQQLWIIVAGEASTAVPGTTVASLRALRDAASCEVEFGTLGPNMALGAKQFASLEDVAEAVPANSLVMFIGARDLVDRRLLTALALDQAWQRDFIVSDQCYLEGERVGYVPFHGIDHVHLDHVDYFGSRFLVSAGALRSAVARGATTLVEVSRGCIAALEGKASKQLHLQFPFITNDDLSRATLRERRHDLMRGLAVDAADPKADWNASVSVVINTKDGGYLLDGLVAQLLNMPRIAEVLVVSNNSSSDYTLDLLDRLSQTDRCSVFKYDKPFNFSVQCNIAARASTGRFLLFLNDDMSLIGSDWLDRLLSDVDVDRPRIAGPLLLYPDQSIQHGGMYLGHNNTAGHAFRHQKHPHDAPMYELVAPRLVSCLTGACLLMKRSLFDGFNGFDEQLATGLQDVDLSLRALFSGAELVFDPRAIIFHLESISLIPTLSDGSVQRRREREYARFRDRWDCELRSDRWHNRNLALEDESLRSIRVGG